MKKLKTIVLLAIVCALGCACLAACGEKDTPGGGDPVAPVVPNTPTAGLAYTLNEDGAGYTVTGLGEATDKNLVIPTEHEGKPVTKIGKQAFLNKRIQIDSVVIPNGIGEIEESAFQGCASMTEVHIAASVETIKTAAFRDCNALTIYCEVKRRPDGWDESELSRLWRNIDTPVIFDYHNNDEDYNGYKYGVIDGVRYKAKEGEATVIRQPENLYGEIVLPSKVVINGSPYTCNEIGEKAFAGCVSLVAVTIPSTDMLLYVAGNITSDCTALTVYCEDSDQPDNWSKKWNSDNCPVVWDCKHTDTADDGNRYVFADGVRYAVKRGKATVVRQPHIGAKKTIAAEVSDPGGSHPVTAIAERAFESCVYTTEIVIGKNIEEIGSGAFRSCNLLEKLTVANDNETFHSAGNCIIDSKSKTLVAGCKSSIIPDDGSVTVIGEQAFVYCRRLVSLTIPDSVTEIGASAFFYCDRLESLTIGAGVTVIRTEAFGNCTKLKNLIIPLNVTTIEAYAFRYFSRENAVYCEAAKKPDGWDRDWARYENAVTSITVVWDCKNQ